MATRRRHIFSAHAAAFGGHIIRPKDVVLEAPAASALTIVGGRSSGRIPATRFEDFFSVRSASTFAEGLFDDRKRFLALTNHEVEAEALTATTRVKAEINGLVIGRKPRLSIRKIRAALTATSPLGSGQPAIRVDQDVLIEGITIDKYRLVVELEPAIFQRLDTHAKVLASADDPSFVRGDGNALFLRTASKGSRSPRSGGGQLIESSNGTIDATIVKSIRWEGKPFPESQIDHNVVVIPDFGRLTFGKLLLSYGSRRLIMVLADLGSDLGGFAAVGDVEDNIIWGN